MGRKDEFREQYDYCVSRAVARLTTLSEYCIPFIKKQGYFISYKSGNVDEELAEAEYAIKQLGAKCERKITFKLPDTDMERSLIVIKKHIETPKKYPRAGGKPSNSPLIYCKKCQGVREIYFGLEIGFRVLYLGDVWDSFGI